MAKRSLNKLTDKQVRSLGPGRYADGGGLYIGVKESGARSWLYMRKEDGKQSWHGLGGYPLVSLADARDEAEKIRKAFRDGRNPFEEKRQAKEEARKTQEEEEKEAAVPTFREVVEDFLADHESGWKNEKHQAQWRATLLGGSRKMPDYCRHLHGMKVSEIDTAAVLRVLSPIWQTRPETARRIRGRIERVLTYAKVHGHRTGENPALWRTHLEGALPKPKKPVNHHRAMRYEDVPDFIAKLRTREGMAARAIEFLILTAARSGEVVNATWDEIDFDKEVWTIPGSRMKANREHRVPLTPQALALLKERYERRIDHFVFPGIIRQRPLSAAAMERVLEDLDVKDVATLHGFRSSFSDWTGDETHHPREIREAALAHVIGDKAEQAYRRKDALERRRRLMEDWANYLDDNRDDKVARLADRRHRKAGSEASHA